MKMWAGLWVEVFRLLAANPLKEMVGTRRLELLTSTVSKRLSAVTHYTLTALTASL
jgi:hypothetical protein